MYFCPLLLIKNFCYDVTYKMSLKEFIKSNKYQFLYSSIALLAGSCFIIAKNHTSFSHTFPLTLVGIPLLFIMSYGIYELSGGDDA